MDSAAKIPASARNECIIVEMIDGLKWEQQHGLHTFLATYVLQAIALTNNFLEARGFKVFDLFRIPSEDLPTADFATADYTTRLHLALDFALNIWRMIQDPRCGTPRCDACRDVARRVPWKVHDPAVGRELVRRAAAEGVDVDTIKRQTLFEAVWLVLGASTHAQHHRFGRAWFTGADGRKATLVPYELRGRQRHLFWKWFTDEVPKAAEAILLDRPYPSPKSRDPFDTARCFVPEDIDGLEDKDPLGNDPLLLLIDDERRREDVARLDVLLAQATPRQRQLLALIAKGASLADAARTLGIAPATARSLLHKLRRAA